LSAGAVAANLQAGGQSAVASGGVILSRDGAASNLLTAGYVKKIEFKNEAASHICTAKRFAAAITAKLDAQKGPGHVVDCGYPRPYEAGKAACKFTAPDGARYAVEVLADGSWNVVVPGA
jgi:hypothetical protein